jgi:hypothetical protein
VIYHSGSDGSRLNAIGPRATNVESSLRYMVKSESQFRSFSDRARYNVELIVVEFAVGDGDERFVLAAVVPPQHALGDAACGALRPSTARSKPWHTVWPHPKARSSTADASTPRSQCSALSSRFWAFDNRSGMPVHAETLDQASNPYSISTPVDAMQSGAPSLDQLNSSPTGC